MYNLIWMKKGANVMVLEVLIMSQKTFFDLKPLFVLAILVRTNFWTVLILVTKQVTKISTQLKLIRLRYTKITKTHKYPKFS
jgi:hypothetical protein